MRASRARVPVALLLAILLMAGFALSHGFVPLHGTVVSKLAGNAAAWLNHVELWSQSSYGAFLLVQTLLALSGAFPASLAGAAAGAIFGLGTGFALSACSTMASAVIAFAMSRSMFRSQVIRILAARGKLNRLDDAVTQDGWRNICLLRLSPIMPFAATSYALGLTGIGWADYLIGTLASLPALFCYVALGRFAGTGWSAMRSGASPVRLGLLLAGLLATGLLAIRIGRILRRTLGAAV